MGLATTASMDKSAIRDAATIIVLRDTSDGPAVLMGQRGATAAFLPGKFVFPGGAVDPNDGLAKGSHLSVRDQERLSSDSTIAPIALAAAAIRELWEETGQILGVKQPWSDPPQGWRGFAESGFAPHAAALTFFFRAVTPAGRPRRFDARFFLAQASDLVTDPDDFSDAEDELSHLQWVLLDQARNFDLPFITKVVLAELTAQLKRGGAPVNVPYFRNDDEAHLVTRLGGHPVL